MGPTRDQNVLDIMATNFNDILTGSGTTEPIRSDADIPKDHLTVYASFRMKRVLDYKIHKTEEGDRKFGDGL